MACRICGGASKSVVVAREMMFGFRDEFVYELCGACSSLQIKDIPAASDLVKYYPKQFWSEEHFEKEDGSLKKVIYPVLGFLLRARLTFAARLLEARLPSKLFSLAVRYGIHQSDRVLDVGCGSGILVRDLVKLGVRDPVGIDPFIARDVIFKNGARIFRADIATLEMGLFDVIMFNHSLEHVADPLATLQAAAARLRAGGRCVLSLPTTSSDAFETFGRDWVQLDAPRHLHIPSRKAIHVMAESAGMRLEDTIDNSTGFQFWGSKQYTQDIPLRDSRSYFVNKNKSIFTAAEIVSYEKQATALNKTHRGDQAIFVLRKI